MAGVRDAANALFSMKAGEICMPLIIITLQVLMILVFGKLTKIIGPPAALERHHAIYRLITLVQRKSLNGVETLGSCGPVAGLVDAAGKHKSFTLKI